MTGWGVVSERLRVVSVRVCGVAVDALGGRFERDHGLGTGRSAVANEGQSLIGGGGASGRGGGRALGHPSQGCPPPAWEQPRGAGAQRRVRCVFFSERSNTMFLS